MALKRVIPVADAVALIRDGDVLATTGYGGNGTPDQLLVALEERFLEEGRPRDLTLIYAGGQGVHGHAGRFGASAQTRPESNENVISRDRHASR